ncbi:MAG: DUF192 domain-containing protein [Burkholderiales bacterium]
MRVFAAACIAALLVVAEAAAAQMPVMALSTGVYLIRAEVAFTFESRAQGLMFRESLGPNEGMLFVFPQLEKHCMWMKNTLIPLSVAFLDEKGTIVSISDMQPQTETSHCAAAPARFALEMTRGWFAAKGIKAGASITGLKKAPAAQ